MPRLRRIHYASLGHRDARLAPLSIDLRDPSGAASDAVLWLRNGGGKSSVLNLFFSTFRPGLHEFLGKAAEGQSRRLTDYVKADDTAFVLTEWETDPVQGSLVGDEGGTRVVGQVLEWRGRQRSSDASRLERRWFSFRTDRELRWEEIPVHGLAGPVASLDAFVAWLRERQSERPAREIAIEENQTRWEKHLESIRLDPELFRYQLQMNRREGAADELFRFSSARQFVELFLELTLDPAHADQVSANLGDFREKIALLPGRRVEREFAVAAREALGPLIAAAEARARAVAEDEAARAAASGLAGALAEAVVRAVAELERLAGELAGIDDATRRIDNDTRRLDRWAEGLDRRAIELDLREAEAAAVAARTARDGAAARHRCLTACGRLREVRQLEVRRGDLERRLIEEATDRAPRLERLRGLGASLAAALGRALEERRTRGRELTAEIASGEQRIDEARSAESAAIAARSVAETQRDHAKRNLDERSRQREALGAEGLIEPREPGAEAAKRWHDAVIAGADRIAELEREAVAQDARGNALSVEVRELATERAARNGERNEAVRTFGAARDERSAIEADPVVVRVEEVEVADALAPGLEARLLAPARRAEAELRELAVEGADDERAAASFAVRGLMPAPVDVERVVQRLRDAGIEAWSAQEYLAENVRDDVGGKRGRIARDPARFTGVMVPTGSVDRATAIAGLESGLRSPVVVGPPSLDANPPDPSLRVLGPESAGTFDFAAAAAERDSGAERIARRGDARRALEDRSASLRRLADRVARFAGTWGDGRYEVARERADALARECARLEKRLLEAEGEQGRLDTRRSELAASLREKREAQRKREGAEARVAAWIEHWERHVPRWRAEVDDAEREIALQSRREREAATAREETMARRDALRTQRTKEAEDGKRIEEERERIAHVRDGSPDDERIPLDTARSRYADALRAFDQELGSSRTQGQLDEVGASLERARALLARERGEWSIEALARVDDEAGDRLDELTARAGDDEVAATAAVMHAEDRERELRARVQALPGRRREADDLPTGEEPPATAEAARARAGQCREEADGHRRRRVELDERRTEIVRSRDALDRTRERRQQQLQRIIEACGVEPGRAVPLPDGEADVEAAVGGTILRAKRARDAAIEARSAVDRAVETVRQVAHDTRFAAHDSAWKQRLFDEPEALVRDASRWDEGLRERVAALDDEIAAIEKDREGVVNGLLGVAEEAARLLLGAERSSRLPDSLGRWAGQPFLKIALDVPVGTTERKARLIPMVDELVKSARIPGGLALAQQAIERLHGSGAMGATILKPEATRRLDRVDVTALGNFSGGERLTAAVLLYCTLVHLRARRRGTAGRTSGNVLILDNPIGTCSSVAMLELQREVARAMGTQLVYTTGVDDLAALAQLPTVVRLRNAHRNVRTGELHVTLEPEEHLVEGVRVTRGSGGGS